MNIVFALTGVASATDLADGAGASLLQFATEHGVNLKGMNAIGDLTGVTGTALGNKMVDILYKMNPILAGLSQYLSTKLMMNTNPSSAGDENQAAQMMKSMNVTMPLMSVFFCFTFPAAVGIYWVASSVFQILQQLIVNKYLNSMEIEAEKEEKKRAEKLEKNDELVKESTAYYNKDAKPGSLASKAGMVAKYNEKHNNK